MDTLKEIEKSEHELPDALASEDEVGRESRIIVNGRERTVDGRVVSYEEVVKIAFPGGPTHPDMKYTVTYYNALKPQSAGEIDAGQSVTVKPGRNPKQETVFNVTPTILS